MLTDACFKEGLSATLKPETSLIGHFEKDNNNDNHNNNNDNNNNNNNSNNNKHDNNI